MKISKEKLIEFIKKKYKGKTVFNNVKISNEFINLHYGLANNCPDCCWFPCVCKEYEEYRRKFK